MADRYFVNGGVDNNWGTTGNWSTTSGGAGGSSVPTAADAVFFDANSPNVTVNASNRVCLSLNFTGYANTITMTFNITSSGSVTLVNAMTIAGAGSLIVNAAATLTSNGKTWPNALLMQSVVTYTFGDNWVVSGPVTIGSGSANIVFNGNQITCNGGLTNSATSAGNLSGTTKFVLSGGTVTSNHTGGGISFPVDYAGNITFASGGVFRISGGTHTYVSGTVTFAGTHTLVLVGSCTFNTSNSIIWKSLTLNSTLTLTLTTAIYCDSGLTLSGGSVTQTINGSIYVGGGLSYTGASGTLTLAGTGEIVMNGTGTISQGAGTFLSSFPLVIDTTGDITITSVSRWDLGKFVVRNAGSITTTEAWDLGGGGGGFRPVNIRGGADQ
jgi:hypothetical protein